jgi:hydrogenase large subunit
MEDCMSSKTITLDPITRISGFLQIKVTIENNLVTSAKSSGMLFRGFEEMLKGRPPLDAIYFTERICGICSTAHSIASTLALENALNVIPDENGKITRDILHGCEFLQNHLRQFYLYCLPDYVDAPDIHPLMPLYHKDYRLPPNEKERIGNNYIRAIKYSRLAHKLLALLGGKAPHNHGVFVGGITVNLDSYKIIKAKSLLDSIKGFVNTYMLQDAYTIAKYYNDYYKIGCGYKNLLSYGLYDDYKIKNITYVKPQTLLKGKKEIFDKNKISEDSYYTIDSKNSIIIDNNSSLENKEAIDKGYTFIKAPRYDGFPMEVGPLARMYLCGDYINGISCMDRIIARVLETKKIISIMEELLDIIKPIEASQRIYNIPDNAFGSGLTDTTRGALGHWVKIKNKKIENYNIITPSNWNLSPKDSSGKYGVLEKALIGTHIEDEKYPAEIGRIVRSFDPCVSCATHVISDKFNPIDIYIG